jgi:hypothetical protein
MYRMKLFLGFALVTTMFATVPAVSAGSENSSKLDGVYRVTWTGQALIAGGASRRRGLLGRQAMEESRLTQRPT